MWSPGGFGFGIMHIWVWLRFIVLHVSDKGTRVHIYFLFKKKKIKVNYRGIVFYFIL